MLRPVRRGLLRAAGGVGTTSTTAPISGASTSPEGPETPPRSPGTRLPRETRAPELASFAIRRVALGGAAGAAAGVVLGLVETAIVAARLPSTPGAAVLAGLAVCAVGLHGLPAALAGALVGLGSLTLPLDTLVRTFRPIAPRLVLALSIVLPCTAAALFRLAHHFATGYHNQTLAALAMAVCALAVLGFSSTGAALLIRSLRRLDPRPAVAWAIAGTVLVAVVAPPLAAGPDGALGGPFGFIGLCAMDALDLALPAMGIVALAVGLACVRFAARLPTRRLVGLSLVPLALAAAGVGALGLEGVRATLGTAAPALPRLVRPIDRALDGDRDGFARLLGGGDCNDDDAAVNPAATDVPGNGRDEDCDGEDLTLADEPVARGPSAAAPAVRLRGDLSFLIITVDAMNLDMGFLGYDRYPTTPRLDRLAARSAAYERAYALGTYTAQSLPPMMAGRYPSELDRTSAHEVRYFLKNEFLAEKLRAAGFRTSGAASHFLFAPIFGWTQGFDRFMQIGSEGDAPPGSHVDLRHSSRLVANDAIRSLEDAERTGGRFFFWYHFLDPHKQYLEHHEARFGGSNRALYDGEIAYTDLHIGRVLDALERAGLADRTVIIVTGDHGEAFGEHGARFHGRETWEEIIRVPLLIHVPGLEPRRVQRRVSHIDLYPTLLELAGLPVPPAARGQSLVPELAGGELPERPILLEQPKNPYYRMRRVFIDQGYKLHHLVEERAFRLFHLDEDPREEHDLAVSDPARLAAVRRAYSRFLAAHVSSVEPVDVAPASSTRVEPGSE
ncbi:MAG: sulfatase-like hydrolase/transferase [Deltaproteobacteria bacterium]|nr:sulfatase-like hydrolase/transferase [Deltaproteobacteria bacterium]